MYHCCWAVCYLPAGLLLHLHAVPCGDTYIFHLHIVHEDDAWADVPALCLGLLWQISLIPSPFSLSSMSETITGATIPMVPSPNLACLAFTFSGGYRYCLWWAVFWKGIEAVTLGGRYCLPAHFLHSDRHWMLLTLPCCALFSQMTLLQYVHALQFAFKYQEGPFTVFMRYLADWREDAATHTHRQWQALTGYIYCLCMLPAL